MPSPICEQLETRPSSVEGWVQWGTVDDAGAFNGLYGLEAALSRAESLYYLAAAGVCEIEGQSGVGQIVPQEIQAPEVSGDGGASIVAVAPQAAETQTTISPVQSGLFIAGFVMTLAGIAWYSQRQGRKTDSTPNPASKYGSNPFGGER